MSELAPSLRPFLRRATAPLLVVLMALSLSLAGRATASPAAVPTTGTITGTVTDAATGKPVAGASVSDPDATSTAPVTTDSSGRYTLTVTAGQHRVAVKVSGFQPDRYADSKGQETVTVTAGATTPNINVALHAFAVLSGRVTSGGAAAAGVTVKLYDADGTDPNPVVTAPTDSQGRFSATEVPSGRYLLQYDAAKTVFLSQWWKGAAERDDATALQVAWGARLTTLDADLPRGATISGRVTDPQGKALSGISVQARENSQGVLSSTQSGSDGRFTVLGLPAGQYTLDFASEDYVDRAFGTTGPDQPARYFSVPEGRDVVGRDMVLPLGGRIEGTIRDADGAPVPYARARAGFDDGSADEDGHYVIPGLEAGSTEVRFDAYGFDYQWWDHSSTSEDASPVTTTLGGRTTGIDADLTPESTIDPGDPSAVAVPATGTVVDDQSRAFAGLEVDVRCSSYDEEGRESTSYDTTTTDASGRFRVGATAGSCTVYFADGALTLDRWTDDGGRGTFTVGPEETVHDLGVTQVNRPATLTGKVTKPNGQGFPDVEVTARSADDETQFRAQTDASGTFSIPVTSDFYTLSYTAPPALGYAPSWWKQAATPSDATYVKAGPGTKLANLDAALGRSASATGRVVDGSGQPAAGVVVTAVRDGSEDQTSVESDDAGEFTLGGLLPGAYTLSADGAGAGYDQGSWQPGGSTSLAISLASGEAKSGLEATVRRQGTVVGKVTDPTGKPVADVAVTGESTADPDDGGYTTTGSDGTYVLRGLSAGSVVVRFDPPRDDTGAVPSGLVSEWFRDASSRADATPLVVAPNTTARADATLELGGAISGTVRLAPPPASHPFGPDETPAPRVVLNRADDDDFYREGTPDSDGRYQIAGLPAGDYEVDVVDDNDYYAEQSWSSGTATTVHVAKGARVSGIDVRLTSGATVAGHVKGSGGTSPGGHVTAVDPDTEDYVGYAKVGSDGSYVVRSLPAGPVILLAEPGWRSSDQDTWFGDTTTRYDAQRITLAADTVRDGADITLGAGDDGDQDPGSTVTYQGRVVLPSDARGQPTIVTWRTTEGDEGFVYPDVSDGSFRITVPSTAKSVTLRARAGDEFNEADDTDLTEATLTSALPAAGPLVLTLTHGGTVVGRVMNETRTPLTGWVTLTDSTGRDHGVDIRNGKYRVSGLPDGPVRLQAQPVAPYVAQWVGRPGDSVQVLSKAGTRSVVPTLTVQLGATLTGRVTVGGDDFEQTEVAALDAEGHVLVSIFADYDTFTLRGVPVGDVRLRYSHEGVVRYWRGASTLAAATVLKTTAGETISRLDAELPAPAVVPSPTYTGRVSGVVTVRGKPVRTATAQLTPEGDDEARYTVETAADGSFELSGVAPGRYLLSADDYVGDHGGSGSVVGFYPDTSAPATLVIADGTTLKGLDFDLGKRRLTQVARPTIAGRAAVGELLSSTTGTWKPTPSTFAYQWTRDGATIVGATSSSYRLTPADLGHAVALSVTAGGDGFSADTMTSRSTASVAAGTIAPATPIISGTNQVGQTLSASAPGWSPAPTTLSYQWRRNGVAISGATGSTYRLEAADEGQRLSVAVTGAAVGYAPATAGSAETGAITQGVLTPATPAVSGTHRVGSRLSVTTTAWPPGATLSYQWLRNGAAVGGATASTYVLGAADRGARMAVRVTGSAPGYAPTSVTSLSGPAVASGVLTSAVPVISGRTKAGSALRVSPGKWGPAPVTLRYQWYRDGRAVSARRGTTYALGAADRRHVISVRVTGSRAGYSTVVRSSRGTARIS